MLGCSKWLAAEGLSFGEIVNQLRSDLATHYLSDPQPSDLGDSMAPRLSGSERILPWLQAVYRNEPEEDARQIAGEPLAEFRYFQSRVWR